MVGDGKALEDQKSLKKKKSKDAYISKYKTENWKILKITSIYQLYVRVKIPRIFESLELKIRQV